MAELRLFLGGLADEAVNVGCVRAWAKGYLGAGLATESNVRRAGGVLCRGRLAAEGDVLGAQAVARATQGGAHRARGQVEAVTDLLA